MTNKNKSSVMISVLLDYPKDFLIDSLIKYFDDFAISLSKKNRIEIILMIDRGKKVKLVKEIEKNNYPFSIYCYSQNGDMDDDDLNNIYTNSFLQTDFESDLVIPVDIETNFFDNWDKKLIDAVNSFDSTEDYFIVKDKYSDVVFFSRKWLDCLSGFGLYKNYVEYNVLISESLLEEDGIITLFQMDAGKIFNMSRNTIKNHVYFGDSKIFRKILTAQKQALLNDIKYSREENIQKLRLGNHDVSICSMELCKNVSMVYNFLKFCLIKHVVTTTQYVLRQHTIPLFDVIVSYTLLTRFDVDVSPLASWCMTEGDAWGIDDCDQLIRDNE
ncbi:MAG: hypothetical protein HRT87_08915 [Legionellales bacterium]|nr:hypothetical protein [Legionellales bacterium]